MSRMITTGHSSCPYRVEREGIQGVQARDEREVSARGDTIADQPDDIAASGGRRFGRGD